jgi:hypothetical protein
MSDTYLDGLLDELVIAEPHEAWDDVLGRARRSRRRYAGVVAAFAALVLAPTTWAAVKAFEGTPAPQVIQQNFSYNRVTINPRTGFVEDLFPAADSSKAHGVLQVATSDGPLDMWAAPELKGNGTCWFVGWDPELNGPNGPRGVNSCTQTDAQPLNWMDWNDAKHPSYTVLIGSVNGSETTLDVTLADGSTTTLPVVEHLFLGALPHGSHVASIVGRDASGNVVATWPPSP